MGRSVTGSDLSDGDIQAKEPAFSLDESVFRSRRLCTRASLDDRMTHLVGLTACLASGCACASGHIVAARKARATNEELTRCACIAACAAGMQVKYAFLTHQQFVDDEDGERFWADAFA
jgi:alkylhydroperoxidase/carboxymuconolactone decarboxylase family protein YurZ